jgi:hypothetical protein
MGNDNKIKDLTVHPKNHFLPEEIIDYDHRMEVYSLEAEFTKTQTNKNYAAIFAIIAFIAIGLIGTILFTFWMESRQRTNEVSITEFEDTRLKDLIDAAKKNKSKLDMAKTELDSLKLDKDKELLSVKDKYKNKREAIAVKNLSADDTAKQLAKLDKEEAAELGKVGAEFDKKIRAKDADIKRIAIESENVSKKVTTVASNVDRLTELKLNKQKKEYEDKIDQLILKYNPKFTNEKVVNILKGKTAYSSNYIYSYKQKINDYSLIMDNMLKVPYINSPNPAIKQMDKLSRPIMNEMYDKVSIYNYAFDYILQQKPESGYIIDARSPERVAVHVNKRLAIQEGEVASIFRTDDEYIGKISLFKSSGGYKGKVIEVASGKKIEPFDKILLNLSRE